nr:retrovirus-related Pol polyprotein from transposon TNT 1-94 [Tanacetum cinerariifolium]
RLLTATITLSNKAEDPFSIFNKWYQSLVRSCDQEKNKIQAQQTKKMVKTSSSSENKPCCSKACKKITESLNSKITNLTDKLFDAKSMIYHYKLGLAQVVARLFEHKDRELKYYEKIRGFEFQTESSVDCIESLKKKLEVIKNEKEGLESKLTAQLYSPPKKDMSWTGLPEFADDTVTDYSRPAPTVESSLDDAQNRNPSVTATEASPSIITSKPVIKFVKEAERPTTNKVETTKKPAVKYAELYRKTTKRSTVRGNQRNWNNLKSQQLVENFVMKNKACFNCGHFDHLYYNCGLGVKIGRSSPKNNYTHRSMPPRPTIHRPYRPPMRPVRPNMNAAQPKRTSFYKPAHSYNKRPFQETTQNLVAILIQRVKRLNRELKARTPIQKVDRGRSRQVPTVDFPLLVYFATASAELMSCPCEEFCTAASQDVKKDVSSLRYIALPNWVHAALLESSSSMPQDDCSTDVPKSSGNSNPTATSINPPTNQLETLTVETSIPIVSLPVPTACFTNSPVPSSDTRLISKRVANQVETPSLDNILTMANRFEDILGVSTNSDESKGVEADVSNMETTITARVRPIGTKWVLKNKKDERRIVIINKVRLVAQGHIQEKGIDYDEVFAPVARIEAIKLFLAYASFMGFTVYQIDVKSAFLYGTIEEEVYVMQPPGFQDPNFLAKVYKVEKAMYGLHQAPRAWYGESLGKKGTGKDVDLHLYRSMIGSLMYLTASRPDIMFAVCACTRHQVTPKECHLYAVKRIFRYLKGHPKLRLWYPKESPLTWLSMSCEALSREISLSILHLYALIVKPTIYVSHIRQFWSTARIETTEEETKILATVDGILRTVTESSLRRNLKLQDEEGISSLPDMELFENLTLMGYNISLNQKFTFQKGPFSHQRARIAQSLALLPIADEATSPLRDVNEVPRITSPAADEGSMQIKLDELMGLCTSLQRQHSEVVAKFEAQEMKINRLKAKAKLLEDRDGVAAERSEDDDPIKGRNLDEGEAVAERVSDDTEEMATILTSMDATTVLASRAAEVPTGRGSIPTVGSPAAKVSTGSDVVPTASLNFSTATVVTPYRRRKDKEIMVESETLKKKRGMTFEEIKAKFTIVWKQLEDFIPMGSKEEAERLKRKGLSLEPKSVKKLKKLEEVPEEAKFLDDVPEEKVKEMMQLVPIEELYDMCGVHQVTSKDKEIFMLVEKDYPLRKGLAIMMICYKLQVENYTNKMHMAFSLPVMKFPLPVKKVATTRRKEKPLLGAWIHIWQTSTRNYDINLGEYPGVDDNWLGVVLSQGLSLLSVDLSGYEITDIGLCHVKDCKNVENLNLNFCDKISDVCVGCISGLHKLALLNMERCPITLACLDSLSDLVGLHYLNISRSNFTDEGCHKLSNLVNLESLNLSFTVIIDEALTSMYTFTLSAFLDFAYLLMYG